MTTCMRGADGAWQTVDPTGQPITPQPVFDDGTGSSWVMIVRVADRDGARIQLSDPGHCAHLFESFTEAASHTSARHVAHYTLVERS